jgi:hypothetical protein
MMIARHFRRLSGARLLIASTLLIAAGACGSSSSPSTPSGTGGTTTSAATVTSVALGAFSGNYTGPNGTSGGFGALDATRSTVTQLCGTYAAGPGDNGIWNLQVSASGAASGEANGPKTVLLSGQISGTALTMTSSEGVTARGTVQNGSVSGSFTTKEGVPATFSGSSAGCR